MKTKGFTLIELMVVISIIALLSSIGFSQFAEARNRANDSKKISEINQVEKAIILQKETTGFTPRNYSCDGSYCASGTGTTVAVEGTQAYNASMQELVTNGYLSSIPKSVDGTYMYYADPTAQIASFGATLKSSSSGGNTGNSCSILYSSFQKCVGLDSGGGVVWDSADFTMANSRTRAFQLCNGMGRRVPTKEELINQYLAGKPAGNFSSTNNTYWSSSNQNIGGYGGFYVDMNTGVATWKRDTSPPYMLNHNVRCVQK